MVIKPPAHFRHLGRKIGTAKPTRYGLHAAPSSPDPPFLPTNMWQSATFKGIKRWICTRRHRDGEAARSERRRDKLAKRHGVAPLELASDIKSDVGSVSAKI